METPTEVDVVVLTEEQSDHLAMVRAEGVADFALETYGIDLRVLSRDLNDRETPHRLLRAFAAHAIAYGERMDDRMRGAALLMQNLRDTKDETFERRDEVAAPEGVKRFRRAQ